MNIKKLKINNILSIADAEIEFKDSGLTLIDGYDYDKGRSNGSGKTSILNSLVFGLFGEIPRKITATGILKRGSKTGFSEVTLQVKEDFYRVKRERPAKCTYYKNDNEIQITQQEFESIIGFTYDQFILSYYIPQNTSQRFLFLNDSGKKDFLLRLMGLESFDQWKQKANLLIKNTEQNIAVLQSEIKNNQNHLFYLNSKLVDTSETEILIASLEAEQQEIAQKITQLNEIQPPDLSKYEELEQKIEKKKLFYQKKRTELAVLTSQINSIRGSIKPFSKQGIEADCPVCSAVLNISGSKLFKQEDIESIKQAHEEDVQDKQNQIQQLLEQKEVINQKLIDESKLATIESQIRDAQKEDMREYQASRKEINGLKDALYKTKEKITYNRSILKNNADILKQIEIYETLIEDHTNNLKIKESELNYNNALYSIFSPTGAPAYLMDSVVDMFNEKVEEYINKVWPNASYSLRSFKENKDKSLKAQFSEELVIAGEVCPIGSISGGELTSLSLCVDFAITETLSAMFGINSNIMCLDEPFVGLDSIGKEIVMETLKLFSINKQIIIIDHASEFKAAFDEVIFIEKRNGTSEVKK